MAESPVKTTREARAGRITPEEYLRLANAAQEGDEAAMAQIRPLIGDDLTAWRLMGDLSTEIRELLLHSMAGKNLLRFEATKRVHQAMVEELAGPDASPLERLLCERIVTAHIAVSLAEGAASKAHQDRSVSVESADYHHRRLDGASRRFLGAVKALALVRRLNVPAAVAQSAVVIRADHVTVERSTAPVGDAAPLGLEG